MLYWISHCYVKSFKKKIFLIFPFVVSFYFAVKNFTNINLPDYLNIFNRFNPTNFFSKIIVLESGALKSTRLDIYHLRLNLLKSLS